MASLNFPPQLKNGSLVIRLSYQTTTADRKFLNTGFRVPGTKIKGVYKFWDIKKQRVKPGADNCEEINDYLQLQENNFLDYLKECKTRHKLPLIDELTQLFKGGRGPAKANETLKPVLLSDVKMVEKGEVSLIKLGPVNELSPMMKLFLKFAFDKNSDVKKDSFKHYKTFALQLQEFEKQRESGLVNINAIDVKFYKEFTRWLITKHNNVNSTLNRKVTRLKTFLNWCTEEGYINIGTFKKAYKLSEVDASKFPLYKSEKDLLYKYIPKAGTESSVY
ncbi:MAG: integrase [Segetibacter sp.]|nr:integrase [Segetibacter sp.]